MKFETQFTRVNEKQFTCPGNPIKIEYELRVVEGIPQLVEIGKTNFQELIQKGSEGTTLKDLVAKFVNGDPNALNGAPGVYLDITRMPENYAELYNNYLKAEQFFDDLQPNIKKLFDNNSIAFWNEFGSDKFNAKLEKEFNNSAVAQDFSKEAAKVAAIKEGETNE